MAFDVLMDFVGLYEYVKRDSKVERAMHSPLCLYNTNLSGLPL